VEESRQTKPRRRWRFDLRGAGFLLFAIVLAGLGCSEIDDQHVFRQRGVVASGSVVDLDHRWKGSDTITVRFVTTDGRTVEAETSNYLEAQPGSTIDVIYDPKGPTRIQAADWGLDYWLPGVLWGGATLLFLIPAILRFWSRADAVA
jgi:hypothetical protein